jgi:hypothetical protein
VPRYIADPNAANNEAACKYWVMTEISMEHMQEMGEITEMEAEFGMDADAIKAFTEARHPTSNSCSSPKTGDIQSSLTVTEMNMTALLASSSHRIGL